MPVLQLVHTTLQKWRDLYDGSTESLHPFLLQRFERAFLDNEASLEIVVPIDQNQHAAVVDVSEDLLRVVTLAADTKPEHIDGDASFEHFKAARRSGDGMPAVATNHQICANLFRAVRRTNVYTRHASLLPEKIVGQVFQAQIEGRKLFALFREELQEIPLGRESDKTATRRQVCVVSGLKAKVSEYSAYGSDPLMRQSQEAVEQVEFVKDFESRGMDGVAAK